MLICDGDLSVPRQALARLLDTEGTAGYAEARHDCRAILVDRADLRRWPRRPSTWPASPAPRTRSPR